MAKPEFYPDWATTDVTLPSTGNTNKVRPKQTLREVGVDYGQLLTCEETNWLFNNTGLWVRYLADEYLDTIPLTYLPKNGTALTFNGDIYGTASWTGSDTGTVTLNSTTLNNATSNPTVGTLVKRDGTGGASFLQNLYGYAPTGENFDYRIYDQVTNAQQASLAWDRSGDVITLYRGTSTAKTSQINLYAGRVDLTSPRSLSSQGSNVADLTRKDYVDGQISDLNTTLRTYINSRSTASLATNGWWKDEVTGFIYQWGFNSAVRDDDYVTITLPITFPNSFFSVVATPSYMGSVGETTSLGSHVHIISTSQFGLGVSDSRTGETVEGAYWIAVGR